MPRVQSCDNLWSLGQEHTLLSELTLLFAWLLAALFLPALGCDVTCDCGTERVFAFSDCLVFFLHWFLPFAVICLNTALVNDAAIAVPPRLGFLLGAQSSPEKKGNLVSLLCQVQEMKYRKK